jgi:ATP phosphoribosyltransferase regulatory subunit
VIFLASKSLENVSEDYVLDLSHLGIVNGVLDAFNISETGKKKIVEFLGEKNARGVGSVCENEGLNEQQTETVKKLVTVYGGKDKVFSELEKINVSEQTDTAIKQLKNVLNALSALGVDDNISIDFSVVSDTNYYNGLVFKGFISGIPVGIISGGQYDNLMQKFKRKDRAIGFAVYLDELEKILNVNPQYDVDVALEYADETDVVKINKAVKSITDGGESVFACAKAPCGLKYKRLVQLKEIL